MADKKPYHHGDLPTVLRAAAADLVSERGPGGFSLREVARRAGVSHAAPAHHFGDARGLLTSLAVEGFDLLAEALTEAAESAERSDPVDWLHRCGAAYVNTATTWPGHFAVVFRDDLLDLDDEELERSGAAAFGCLAAMVETVRSELNPDLDVVTTTMMCWATMQGLVTLEPAFRNSPLAADLSLDTAIDAMISLMLSGLRPR